MKRNKRTLPRVRAYYGDKRATYIDEGAMAEVVEGILKDCPRRNVIMYDGTEISCRWAEYSVLREKIPSLVNLSRRDLRMSKVRKGERMWEQIIRNIGSHVASHDEFVRVPGGLGLRAGARATVTVGYGQPQHQHEEALASA